MGATKVTTWGVAGAKSFTVVPSALGDVMVLASVCAGAGGTTAVSGGGVTTWIHLAGPASIASDIGDIWFGAVTTTGSSTVTVTSVTAAGSCFLTSTQFTAGVAGAWSADTSGSRTNANSTTMTWPTLVPAASGELYYGIGWNGNGPYSSPSAGYTVFADATGLPNIYNGNATGSQTPTNLQNIAGVPGMVAGLITFTAAGGSTNTGWFDMFE